MPEVEIPGGRAVIRDELTRERDFRVLEAGAIAAAPAMVKLTGVDPSSADTELTQAGLTAAEAAGMMEFQDAAIVAFLESWTLRRPLPTLANVGDLERDLYRALAEATAPLARTTALGPDFTPEPDDAGGLVDSPFDGLKSSSSPPEDAQDSPSTEGQPSFTESSDSAPSSAA